MNVVSLFAGAGGFDLGFKKAGFTLIWANERDKDIWNTYRYNHPNAFLDTRSIVDIPSNEIPNCHGIIGGPPCQSWSHAGSAKGIQDKRGQLIYEFIRIVKGKQPRFFVMENVSGLLQIKHKTAFTNICSTFNQIGYTLNVKMLNAADYGIPQDRKRVFFVGLRKDLGIKYQFPKPMVPKVTLHQVIKDIQADVLPAKTNNRSNKEQCIVSNHEYMTGDFSSRYLSRNRVRTWNEQSFTIQAGGRHAPIHPQAPKMIQQAKDSYIFKPQKESLYRRLSIRECARIQTFSDDFLFFYDRLMTGYKMVGNAVPVNLAIIIAKSIKKQLSA
ncbi:DNA cytosine methyltransferase [Aureispira anguillae]|uniref:DNA (cytosine-5-)-methyltransferase n=1 Tax=Aureispira anguillae TaxID=2864201 RepID=A0A916DXF5_9BACT|nr:DNA cytosine methyltransferase [Aureispira anguillae]BDS15700.1 DNA cytosine methyltransferase [Aureispira anguillae]